MKNKSLHLQILSYLKKQKNIVNLREVFNHFLEQKQGILIQEYVSECRGKDCFKRMSAILFAINRLQQDHQIVLSHIDIKLPKNNPNGINTPLEVGYPNIAGTDGKVTGDYQTFLKEHICSPIYISEEAGDYLKRRGVSKEIQLAKIQMIVAVVTMLLSIVSIIIVRLDAYNST